MLTTNGREGSSRIQQVKWSFTFLGAVSSGSRVLFLNHTYLTILRLSQPRFSPGYIKITRSKESIISECGIPAIPCLNPVIFFVWQYRPHSVIKSNFPLPKIIYLFCVPPSLVEPQHPSISNFFLFTYMSLVQMTILDIYKKREFTTIPIDHCLAQWSSERPIEQLMETDEETHSQTLGSPRESCTCVCEGEGGEIPRGQGTARKPTESANLGS